jgi:hypothetical protein
VIKPGCGCFVVATELKVDTAGFIVEKAVVILCGSTVQKNKKEENADEKFSHGCMLNLLRKLNENL